ncbi:MAG: hypothetical protein ACK5L0_00245 [Candidatus Fimivivens sp.]
MEKFVPFDKLSKKRQRILNAMRRKSWGAISPVTRKPEHPKAYNRKKTREWGDEPSMTVSF